jgi:AAA+ superfamily predicted ATPase
MRTKIMNYVKAGYPGIYIVSSEETRVESEMRAVAESLKHKLYAWSVVDGLVDSADGSAHNHQDPMEMLTAIGDLPENSLVLLRDFHQFIESPNPMLTRQLKDTMRVGKTKGRIIVIAACRLVLPPELEREFVIVDFSFPGREELGVILENIAKSARKKKPDTEARDRLLDAASGLTSMEAENAFALSVIEAGELSPSVVSREKAMAVKKSGILEICSVTETLDDIGGLDVLKTWLLTRKDAFGQRARQYRLPSPKGLLIVGIPGTGKSLTAKATASVFQRPLVRLDAGRLYGGLVGESEANARNAIQTLEAIAPCVCWIDEIEKGFAGSRSSGVTDGGTSSRVFGTFMSWMQEKTSPVFIVATANDVSQLPPEMLRKGRFDELFFVDLPEPAEREAIWRIQIGKHGRTPEGFKLAELVKTSEGFTGSEIEQAFIEALFLGFSQGQEPTDKTVIEALANSVPLGKLMGEHINALRKWAKGRARPATASKEEHVERKLVIGMN